MLNSYLNDLQHQLPTIEIKSHHGSKSLNQRITFVTYYIQLLLNPHHLDQANSYQQNIPEQHILLILRNLHLPI